jgi:hypothetical protein
MINPWWKSLMTRRKFKNKWHRYGSILGVILVALGGLLMLLYGAISLLEQTTPDPFFLSSYISLNSNISFLFSIIPIIVGILLLVITARQKHYNKDTIKWMVAAGLLAVLGGTLGGLIAFGGALIYFLFYII